MANCFTHGHRLPRTTTEWDSALVWYLQHSQAAINPGPPPPPPPTVEREWRETLRRMRRSNFSCVYSAMDDGPSYKAVTDPPFTVNTEVRTAGVRRGANDGGSREPASCSGSLLTGQRRGEISV